MKKSKRADLEGKRISFLLLGFVIAGSIVLSSLSYRIFVYDEVSKIENDIEIITVDQVIEYDIEIPKKIIPVVRIPVVDEVEPVDNDKKVDVIQTIDTSLIDYNIIDIDEPDTIKITVIYDVAPISPKYPGGPAEMVKFIQNEFEYPEISKEMGEQGTVWIEFIVKSNGKIIKTKIVKGVSDAIDKESIKTINNMPNWIPGEKDGKKVNVRLTIPIRVKLG